MTHVSEETAAGKQIVPVSTGSGTGTSADADAPASECIPLSWDDMIRDRILGHGTTGLVHLARSRHQPGKKYAVKSIVLDTLSDSMRRYVENEVVTMKSLDHPNIIQFISSFKDSSPLSSAINACYTESLHIVMEYASCGALASAVESRSIELPDSVLLEWFVQLCSALYYLHSRRICHRDVKLQNIFLSRRHHVKLGDFGISTSFHTAHPVAETMVGTPLCFSPEQCEGLPYDEKCDVWALGVVLYQLCNGGKAPFAAENMLALAQQIISDPTPAFLPRDAGKPPRDARFEILCRAMLRKRAHERPSVAEILQNFVRLPATHPSHPDQDPARSRTLQKMCGPKEVLKQQLLQGKTHQKDTEKQASSGSGDVVPEIKRVQSALVRGVAENEGPSDALLPRRATEIYRAPADVGNGKSPVHSGAKHPPPARLTLGTNGTGAVRAGEARPAVPGSFRNPLVTSPNGVCAGDERTPNKACGVPSSHVPNNLLSPSKHINSPPPWSAGGKQVAHSTSSVKKQRGSPMTEKVNGVYPTGLGATPPSHANLLTPVRTSSGRRLDYKL